MTINNDYTIITKFIGCLSNKIIKKFGIKKSSTRFSVRVIFYFSLFFSIGFILPYIVGILTGDYLVTNIEIALLFVWFLIGGLLIELLEYSVDDFWEKFKKISKLKEKDFEDLKLKYNNSYFSWKFSGLISLIVWPLACLAASNELSYHSHTVIIMIFFQLVIPCIMWGIVAWMTFYTYYFTWKICRTDIEIEPFAPDGVGGLSIIANLPIRIAFILSSLSLYIPYSMARNFLMGQGTQFWFFNVILESLLFFVIGLMICTFFIPLIPIYRLAKKNKNNLLDKDRSRLKEITYSTNKENSTTDPQILVLFEHYKIHQKMRLWPYNSETIFKFIGTIFIPFSIFMVEYLVLR